MPTKTKQDEAELLEGAYWLIFDCNGESTVWYAQSVTEVIQSCGLKPETIVRIARLVEQQP